MKMSLLEYLDKLSICVDDEYGRQIRQRFADNKGTADLAMLASPSSEELEQLKKAVAIMTLSEKKTAEKLNDEQVAKIAEDAKIDAAIFAIFINGYSLELKK